jgi:hypothetical protein
MIVFEKNKILEIGILQIFMFPIYPNFIQSLSLIIFGICAIFRFEFKKKYSFFFITTSFILIQMLSIFWTSDYDSFLKEFSFLFLIFSVNFLFSFYITDKLKKYYKLIHLIFIISLIIYTLFWIKFMISGLENFCKFVDLNIFFYHNHNYGKALVDKSVFGITFLEQNYFQKIYSLLNIGFFKNQPIDVIAERGYFEIGYHSDFFHHHTYIGLMVLYIILFIINSLIKSKQKMINILISFFLIAYFLIFIQLLDSTFIKFFTIIVLPIFIYFNLKFRYKYSIFTLIIISIFIFIYYSQNNFFSNVILYRDAYSIADQTSIIDYIRFNVYKATFKALSHINIWFGVGVGDAQLYINSYIAKVRVSQGILGQTVIVNSHNQYFSILLKTGILGLGAFFVSLVFNISQSIRNINSLYFFLVLSFLFCFAFENMLERFWGALFFALFLNINFYFSENKN